jgi:hypothetical protein
MPRAIKDYEHLQHKGTYNWREAVNEGKGLGILTVSPCQEMLSPEGYKKEIGNKNTGTYITAIYDESFIRDFIHKKIVVALGFMDNDGLKSDEFIEFMSKQLDYSSQESKRISESKLIKDAQELAKNYGHDVDHWLNTLRQGLATNSNNQKSSDSKPSANGVTKEKAKV